MDYSNPLLPLTSAWVEKIQQATRFKRSRFGCEAEEGMRFFCGPYDFFFDTLRTDRYFRVPRESLGDGSIIVTVNKVAEMVQIFGPTLYFKNPVRTCTPRKAPQLPASVFVSGSMGNPQLAMQLQQMALAEGQAMEADQARADLMCAYLNYTPSALDLKTHNRRAIDEALIKGLGITWTEPYRPAGSPYQMVGSFYDSSDNFVLDPDAKSIDTPKWVARRCCRPVWEVEREFGLPPGYLRPMLESSSQWAAVAATDVGPYIRGVDSHNDLVVYWKIYSKMGLGGRLPRLAAIDPTLRQVCDLFGDFTYMVVCVGVPHPLNMPPWITSDPNSMEMMRKLCQWPTPYWADGKWPFTPFYFHEIPNDPWPLSHLSPALGELKFLNWAYTKMVNKIRTTSRDIIVCKDDLAQAVRDAIISGEDLEVVETESLDQGKSVSQLIEFIQHPTWKTDFWMVVDRITDAFEKRTGLSELMYGQTQRQDRSAAESKIKAGQVSVRPDDMANKVEDAASNQARLEAFAAHWHLTPQDVTPVFGQLGAYVWAQTIYVGDPTQIIYNLETSIEAGSAKKQNKESIADTMNQAIQTLFQPLFAYAQGTGNVGPINALMADWGHAIDLPNVERYELQPPAPPVQPPGQGPPQQHPQQQGR